MLVMCVPLVFARDIDGRYAQSPLKQWFDGLHSKRGMNCCSQADGTQVDDPDWWQDDKGYHVRLEGRILDVPDEAVVDTTNKVGYAIVWPITYAYQSVPTIRCFMPGSRV
jgi:hypothetical protein